MAYKMYGTILLFPLVFAASSAACNVEDEKALIAFKNSFHPNTFPRSWDADDNCCFWSGVQCQNESTGRVTSLSFAGDDIRANRYRINLKGSIPSALGDLTALESIKFQSHPDLEGHIPQNLAKLNSLKYFILHKTGISGPIPSFFSAFTDLVELEISYAKLSGAIPTSFGSLANLQRIDFTSNKLIGTIPENLFSELDDGVPAELRLPYNKLTGGIPQSFASINWGALTLRDNKLCGQIPVFRSYRPRSSDFTSNKCLCGKPLHACEWDLGGTMPFSS